MDTLNRSFQITALVEYGKELGSVRDHVMLCLRMDGSL